MMYPWGLGWNVNKKMFTTFLILGVDEFFWKTGSSREMDIDFQIAFHTFALVA